MKAICQWITCMLFLFSFFTSTPSWAQSDSTKRSDLLRLGNGLAHNFTQPLRWKKKEWLATGFVLAGTTSMSLLDKPVQQFWVGKSDPSLDLVNDIGDFYGKAPAALIATGGFYLTGLIMKDEWTRETGLMLATGLITSGVMESVIKPVVGRARPNTGLDHYEFRHFTSKNAFNSFPSGHTTIALTMTLILAQRIKNIPVRILLYSLAGATVICRLYSNEHWLSDIGFGSAIAWYSAHYSVQQLAGNRYRHTTGNRISFLPYVGGMKVTIAL